MLGNEHVKDMCLHTQMDTNSYHIESCSPDSFNIDKPQEEENVVELCVCVSVPARVHVCMLLFVCFCVCVCAYANRVLCV